MSDNGEAIDWYTEIGEDLPEAKECLLGFLESIDVRSQLLVFQVWDSILWCRFMKQSVVDIKAFAFTPVVEEVARHALALDDDYQALNDTKGLQKCGDFPTTLEEKKDLVRELYDAMRDCSDKIDNTPAKRGKRKADGRAGASGTAHEEPHGNAQVRRVQEAPNVVLEILCWKLLNGAIGISPWDGIKPKYEAYGSFHGRFAELLEAVKKSKAMVDNLMEVDFVKRLAAAPKGELTE
ncbi:hypothetical protein GE09DRAFT_1052521 [Coniochaeta sp. 2T2.1]|nr:hypothetical protein GE09DRAFT_1052521 [Coniochaeta sp. 2T2.1]